MMGKEGEAKKKKGAMEHSEVEYDPSSRPWGSAPDACPYLRHHRDIFVHASSPRGSFHVYWVAGRSFHLLVLYVGLSLSLSLLPSSFHSRALLWWLSSVYFQEFRCSALSIPYTPSAIHPALLSIPFWNKHFLRDSLTHSLTHSSFFPWEGKKEKWVVQYFWINRMMPV